MQEGRPSGTAHRVAMRRAAHQLYDAPLVFTDPLAIPVIGPEALQSLHNEPESERQSPRSQGMRAFMAVRSRFAEDELAASVERGVRQYVVLGAGLDTFAYRNPFPGLTVFEVDYPATQTWKRHRLEAAGLTPPPSMRFAPVDFEHQTLAEGLAAAGFQSQEPAFFSCLGVIPYLSRAAAMATLAYVASLPPGSGIAFDYGVPRERLKSDWDRAAFDELSSRVAAAGEPFHLYFAPEELESELRALGFHPVEDLDGAAINARYFAGRPDELQLRGSLGHLICARLAVQADAATPQS
jgi:methyltransferase (TIGR00027 family)